MKYSIDENKLRDLISSKVQGYFEEATKKFEELNPQDILGPEYLLSTSENMLINKAQEGEINPDEMPADLLEKISKINKRLEEIAEKEKSGELDLKLFTLEELTKFFTISEEEIKTIIYNGQEAEPVQES